MPALPSGTAEYFAAPDGSPSGDGSKSNPWDLRTALNQPQALQPGSVLSLRGGTYVGKFTSSIKGTESAPITVRSYPCEWAVLDGYKTAALGADLGSATAYTDSTVTLSTSVPVGTVVRIDDEQINLYNQLSATTYTGVRGWNGTTVAAHSAGTAAIFVGTDLTISGTDTVYRDFEVRDSYPVRVDLINSNNDYNLLSSTRGDGISIQGARNKVINTVVHDTLDGIVAWGSAPDSEIYGNLIYNVGIAAADRGHGHSLYQENATGTRLIEDNIAFNSFSLGTQCYGVTGPFVGGHLEGNVMFNAGAPFLRSQATRDINLLVGTQSQSIPSVEVVDNFLFQPQGLNAVDLKMGYAGIANDTAVVTGNYLTSNPVSFDNWANVTFTGNEVVAYGNSSNNPTVQITHRPSGGVYIWDNNTYYDQTRLQNCFGGSLHAMFQIGSQQGVCGSFLRFGEWQSDTGFDTHGTYQETLPPNAIFVRRNRYDSRRGHVIVYNWQGLSTVSVDLSSILPWGSAFEVRNAQDYFAAPVVSGTYAGGTVELPMAGLSVATPIGYDFTPASTAPTFAVFVVLVK